MSQMRTKPVRMRDLEDVLDEVYAKYSVNFEKYVDFAERTIEKNKIV